MQSQLDGAGSPDVSLNQVQDGVVVSGNAIDPENIGRNTKALLTSLRNQPSDLERVAEQISKMMNLSTKEDDAQAMHQVLSIVCQGAIQDVDMANVTTYAQLCKKIWEGIDPLVKHREFKDNQGQPMRGGQLLKKLLSNDCQEHFEEFLTPQGGFAKSATTNPVPMMIFFAELFKVQMLPERVMHECIKALLKETATRDPKRLLAVCALLAMAGPNLDTPKAENHMDAYFSILSKSADDPVYFPHRILLLNVIRLRDQNWVSTDEEDTSASIALRAQLAAIRLCDEIEDTTLDVIVLEFFETKTIDDQYFNSVPASQQYRLVMKLTSQALRRGDTDIWLLAALFAHVTKPGARFCSTQTFLHGISSVMQLGGPDISARRLSILLASIGSHAP